MIEWRQEELGNLVNKYAGEPIALPPVSIDRSELTQADIDLIAKAAGSRQGDKFQKLFAGKLEGYPSHSEADLAFCCMLSFWCKKDPEQMGRIFRESGLCREKWDEHHGKLTYGEMTIQKAIDQTESVFGENQAASKKVYSAPIFKLTQASKIEIKAILWLIRNLIELDTLALLFSDPGIGKSFLAIAIALCVATGTRFYGREVKQGPVIFIAGEGQKGLKRRMMAWSIANNVSIDNAPLFISQMPAALTDTEMLEQVQAAIELISAEHGPPVLIIIDTLARNFGPGDENSTKDMSQFIQAADALRAISQATVLLVHHSGHGDKSRARGAMALKGALDAEYRLDRDEAGIIRMEATKMKDAKYPEPMAFKLESILIPVFDETGEPVFSAVLESTSYSPPPQKGKAGHGKHQTRALQILKDRYNAERRLLELDGRDPATARISIEAWKKAMKSDGMPTQRIPEVVDALRRLKMITERGGFASPIL